MKGKPSIQRAESRLSPHVRNGETTGSALIRHLHTIALAAYVLVSALTATVSIAGQDQPKVTASPAMGAKVFAKCSICHTVDINGPSGFGPNLAGIVGAKAGQKAGYSYSPAMGNSGIVWTPALLDKFMIKPAAVVPGTRMLFAGIKNPKDRADLIAYLDTMKAAKR